MRRLTVASLMVAIAVIAAGLGYYVSTQSKGAKDRQVFIDHCRERAAFFGRRADDIRRKSALIEAGFGPDHDVTRRVRNVAEDAARKADLYRRMSELDFGAILESNVKDVDTETQGMRRFDVHLEGYLRELEQVKP